LTLRELAKEQHANGDAELAQESLRESLRRFESLVSKFPNEPEYVELLKETKAVRLMATAP
jgi:hypothetical protein